jgi:AcrR family transcriptional regulator
MSDTKQAILQAASAHYIRAGLAGLSMRAIAKEVGVSATAIYRHYDDKLALVFALVAEGYERFATALREGTQGEEEALPRLLALAEAYVDFALEDPATYQLLFLSTHHLAAGATPSTSAQSKNVFDLPPELQAAGRDSLWILVSAVERAMDKGVLKPSDALTASRILWAQLHGLVSLQLAQRLGVSDAACRDLCRRGFAAAIEGLSPRSSVG